MPFPVLRALSCLGLTLCLSACGGGGGGSDAADAPADTSPIVLPASYYRAGVSGRAVNNIIYRTDFGRVDLAPDGGAIWQSRANLNRTIQTLPDLPMTFGPGTTGDLHLLDAGLPRAQVRFAAPGDVGVGMFMAESQVPDATVWIREQAAASANLLRGTWHSVAWLLNDLDDQVTASFRPVLFNGISRVDLGASTLAFRERTVTTLGGRSDDEFAVDPSGRLRLFRKTLEGGVAADGQLAVAAGPVSTAVRRLERQPEWWACVPASQDATNMQFQGTYAYVALQRTGPGFTSSRGRLVADGQGGLVHEVHQINVDGALSDPGASAGLLDGYFVSGDGTLVLTSSVAVEANRLGAVSPDGRYAILINANAGSGPTAFVALRLSDGDGVR